MGQKVPKPQVQGLLVPSDRLSLDTLDATASSFSQAGAGPGQATSSRATSKLTLEISGGQEQPLELLVRRAGLPEIGTTVSGASITGLGMQWRLGSESADTDWRGHNRAQVPEGWFGITNGPADRFALVVAPISQTLVAVYGNASVTGALQAQRFDFDAGEWAPAVDVSVNPDVTGGLDQRSWNWVAAVALPDDRLLAITEGTGSQFDTYVSEDRGTTWSKYAEAGGGDDSLADLAAGVYFRGSLVLFVANAGGALQQNGSRDLATSWEDLDIGAPVNVDAVAVDVLPNDGGIVLATLDASDSRVRVRVLQSAFQPYDDVTSVVVEDVAADDLVLAVDGAGAIWVWVRETAEPDEIRVFVSYDGGTTWSDRLTWATTAPAGPLSYRSDNPLIYPTGLTGRYCRGHLFVAHNSAQPTSTSLANSLGTYVCSGWSNLVFADESFAGLDVSASQLRQTGIPIERPANISASWSQVGSIPPSISPPGELVFTSLTTLFGWTQLDPAGTTGNPLTVHFDYRIASGSYTTPTSKQAAAAFRVGGASSFYEFELRFLNDQTVLWDTTRGGSVGAIPIDNTVWHDWLVSVSSAGAVTVAYRTPLATRWTFVETAVEENDAAGATNRFQFGIFGSGVVGTTRSRHWFIADELLDTWTTRGRADPIGGNVTTARRPLPGVGSSLRATFLSATRGPGVRNEVLTVDPFYSYGVENLFPRLSPSPARPWRSTDTAEQILAWDLRSSTGALDRLGSVWHHGVALIGCNFRQAVVEYTRDGTTWLTANAPGTQGTWDAADGFTGLTYDRRGQAGNVDTAWLRPSSTTVAGARVLARNELAGGHAVIGGVAYRITANSAGVWSAAAAVGQAAAAATQIAEVRIEGAPPATGTVDLVWPSAVLWNRAINGNPALTDLLVPGFAQKVRLRIPAGQPTVEGVYQIGALVLGSTMVLGKRSSRGWVQAMEPNVARSVSRAGTIRKRQLGPNRRRWTWNWADGVAQKYGRDAGAPDYLQLGPDAVSGAALAIRDDVWTNLWGLLDELEGGAVPVVAAADLPLDGDGLQTDRTLFVYATLDSAIQFTQVQGNEGTGEFGRVEPLRLTELV